MEAGFQQLAGYALWIDQVVQYYRFPVNTARYNRRYPYGVPKDPSLDGIQGPEVTRWVPEIRRDQMSTC